MKKTLTVNLGGFVFHIDEDACIRLESYLKKIEQGLSSSEEAKEVIHDIELRLSELFKERLGSSRQVINMEDVNYVIKIMGEPEDINEGTGAKQESGTSSGSGFGKRMYRDPDNRVLGGVGAGLGAYFGLDPVVIRIILVLTFFAFGPLLYIVLWIAMPEAKTAAQKLEMKGEPVNVGNIQKNVREEYEKVKTNLNKGNTKREVEDVFRQIFLIMGRIALVFFKVILWITGIALIVAGIALLLSFTDVFVFDGWQTGLNGLTDVAAMFVSPAVFNLFIIAIFFLIGIPVVSILFGLMRMVTGMKKNRHVSTGLGIAWFSGIALLIILSVTQIRHFRSSATQMHVEMLDSVALPLTIKTIIPEINSEEWSSHESRYLWSSDSENRFNGLYALSELYIYRADDSIAVIKTEKTAQGINKATAAKNADCDLCAYSVNGSEIFIEPGFLIGKEKPFRFQRCKIKLYIPEGDTLILSPETAQILVHAEKSSYLEYHEMAGKKWVMTEKGLKETE
jgi:phage shock protein PspC (stress-responsive transcriptional regulator)